MIQFSTPIRILCLFLSLFSVVRLAAQPLFSPPSGVTNYELIWDSSPSASAEVNWSSAGATSSSFSNVDNSGINITFSFTGDVATLGDWNSLGGPQTPVVGTNASIGGAEVLEYFTDGFNSVGTATLTITFSEAVSAIGFDLYHINGAGPNGDSYLITATTGSGGTIYPSFTASSSPSYTTNATGFVNSNNNSASGTNGILGLNFADPDGITTITIVWDECTSCTAGTAHGSGIGNLNFCPMPIDNDGDGIPDFADKDDDNDGILDEIESCGSVGSPSTAALTIEILLDDYASETNWDVRNSSGTIVLSGGGYDFTDNNSLITATLPNANGDYTFNITDDANDGICCGYGIGHYEILLDGVSIIGGSGTGIGNFGASATENFTAGSLGAFSCLGADPSLDADGDGVLNYQDPDFCTLNAKGVCNSLDTDGDGIIDQLDLDADGDGCPDAIEGAGSFTLTNTQQDTLTGGINSDGIPLIATNNGQGVGESQNASTVICCDAAVSAYTDTDGDNVADECDLDDDNDGIPDTIEDAACFASLAANVIETVVFANDFGSGSGRYTDPYILSHSFRSSGSIPDGSYAVCNSLESGLAHYNRSDLIGDLDANINVNDGPAGGSSNGRYLSINMNSPLGVFPFYRVPDLATEVGKNYRFRVDFAGLCNGCTDIPNFTLQVQDTFSNVLATISSASFGMANDDVWRRVELDFVATTNLVDILIINAQSNGSAGNDVGVDNIVLSQFSCDTDRDGIANSLDLDSDNDGISDIVEAGGTDSDGDGQVDDATDTDSDGLANTFETADGSTSILFDTNGDGTNNNDGDSDSDGLADFIDLDADNDGIVDNTEAQSTAGYIAPSGSDTDADGIDDAYDIDCNPCGAVTGFAIDPVNTDGSDQADYRDSDSDDDGRLDIVEGHDTNNDSKIDHLDSPLANLGWAGSTGDLDGDGLLDGFDNDNISWDATNGSLSPSSHPDAVSGTSERNWRENVPLPVEWLSFSAKLEGDRALLEWATASETNTDFYRIERSVDGNLFSPIGKEAATGTSNQTSAYEFRDANLSQMPVNRIYYRLRQVDIDGSFDYSRVVELDLSGQQASLWLIPMPIPASQSLTVRYGTMMDFESQLSVYSLTGKQLYYENLPQGQGERQIEVANWPNAIYYLRLESEGQQIVRKFQVKH
ncbi:MAG: T9SS type A sorting domain-containing protein [Bacteroidota bacterium]